MFSQNLLLLSVIRRMASSRNVAVVLAAHGAPMVSIDINVAIPAAPNSSKNNNTNDKNQSEPGIARIVEKNMLRPRDDSALKTIERLRLLLGPPDLLKSRAGKKSKEELLSHCPSAELLDADGKVIDLAMTQTTPIGSANDDDASNNNTAQTSSTPPLTNDAAFKLAKSILLAGNSSMPLTLPIRYNIPTVTAVQPPNVAFVGVPCVSTGITTMFATEKKLLYEWDISPHEASFNNNRNNNKNNNSRQQEMMKPAAESGNNNNTEPPKIISKAAVLVPPAEALGKKLRFRVRIDVEGSLWTEVESPVVQPTPKGFSPMPRWAHLKPKQSTTDSLRLVSYNILHDGFCTSKRSRARLYPFASNDVLDLNYRRARIAQELIKYDGDIIGLQEVGRSVFDGYLDPIMRSQGYTNKLKMKNNNSREGVALLVKSDRFEVERYIEFTLNLYEIKNKIFEEEKDSMSDEERANLQAVLDDPQFEEAMQEVPSVGMIAVLRDKLKSTDEVTKKLVVGNTHLYYHADGCHIRMLQTYLMTRRMEKLCREETEDKNTKKVVAGTVLLGDFNFTRETGSYAMVTKGKVEKDHDSWNKSQKYYWGVDDDNKNAAAGGEAEIEQEMLEQKKGSISNDDDFEEQQKQIQQEQNAAAGGGEEGNNNNDDATASNNNKKKYLGPSEKGVALDMNLPSSTKYLDLFKDDKTLECTNYSLWFKAIIDHIFISQNEEESRKYFKSGGGGANAAAVIEQLLPAPSMDDLSQNIAIPSHMYPSDHVALVADVKLE